MEGVCSPYLSVKFYLDARYQINMLLELLHKFPPESFAFGDTLIFPIICQEKVVKFFATFIDLHDTFNGWV